ncbi:hypothetical protein BT96DRAFT_924180 [Gymnopus androsaceus JB14]|uniref:Mid2 domain-containing protein n=1 Tax=Gymnopus androsaceus JB14 TaxID=1447944 RepID=A0A6A4H658_9AGAR|nr:hypothetical protein BT96DRAFT_924180 [Gymnopus androsaceus JB14]
MRASTASLISAATFSTGVAAICSSFSYGVGNVISLSDTLNRCESCCWKMRVLKVLMTTSENPCNSDVGKFGCTAAPITFNRYTNITDDKSYNCLPEPYSGEVCGNNTISVCCGFDDETEVASKHKSLAGPIAGGVIGGVILVLLLGLMIFCIKRRRQRRAWHQQDIDISENFSLVEAEHLQSSPTVVSQTLSPKGNKWPPVQVMNWSGPSGGSQSTDPISENPSNTTDSNSRHIPTSDLLDLLQTRIKEEGRPEQGDAPPAYESRTETSLSDRYPGYLWVILKPSISFYR